MLPEWDIRSVRQKARVSAETEAEMTIAMEKLSKSEWREASSQRPTTPGRLSWNSRNRQRNETGEIEEMELAKQLW